MCHFGTFFLALHYSHRQMDGQTDKARDEEEESFDTHSNTCADWFRAQSSQFPPLGPNQSGRRATVVLPHLLRLPLLVKSPILIPPIS